MEKKQIGKFGEFGEFGEYYKFRWIFQKSAISAILTNKFFYKKIDFFYLIVAFPSN